MKDEHFIHLHNPFGKGKRVLFIGGPMTYCQKLGDTFPGGFGLGASCKRNDYVHRVMRFAKKVNKDPAFLLISSKIWEENYKDTKDIMQFYKDCINFNPDTVILQLCDYMSTDDFDYKIFKNSLKELIKFIDPSENSQVVLITAYETRATADSVQKIANELNLPCLYLGNLMSAKCYDPSSYNDAPAKYYPNDQAMKKIAQAVMCIIENSLRK